MNGRFLSRTEFQTTPNIDRYIFILKSRNCVSSG